MVSTVASQHEGSGFKPAGETAAFVPFRNSSSPSRKQHLLKEAPKHNWMYRKRTGPKELLLVSDVSILVNVKYCLNHLIFHPVANLPFFPCEYLWWPKGNQFQGEKNRVLHQLAGTFLCRVCMLLCLTSWCYDFLPQHKDM